MAVGGTYWVQALAYAPEVLLAGSGMGAMATAILVVNNLYGLMAARARKLFRSARAVQVLNE